MSLFNSLSGAISTRIPCLCCLRRQGRKKKLRGAFLIGWPDFSKEVYRCLHCQSGEMHMRNLIKRKLLLVTALALIGAVSLSLLISAYHSHALKSDGGGVPNPNCTLIVPANPLTATGLATPYQLTATDVNNGPCNEANAAQSAFIQAAVFDPATNTISIYDPLVIDQGTQPATAPVIP